MCIRDSLYNDHELNQVTRNEEAWIINGQRLTCLGLIQRVDHYMLKVFNWKPFITRIFQNLYFVSNISLLKYLLPPVVTYVSEAWTFRTADTFTFKVFDQKIIRKIYSPE